MQVENDFYGSGLDREKFAPAWCARAAAPDGSMAVYAHLKPESVTVQPGRHVYAGDQLGASGNTGCPADPHFCVQVSRNMRLVSVPFRLGRPGGRGCHSGHGRRRGELSRSRRRTGRRWRRLRLSPYNPRPFACSRLRTAPAIPAEVPRRAAGFTFHHFPSGRRQDHADGSCCCSAAPSDRRLGQGRKSPAPRDLGLDGAGRARHFGDELGDVRFRAHRQPARHAGPQGLPRTPTACSPRWTRP